MVRVSFVIQSNNAFTQPLQFLFYEVGVKENGVS